MTCLFDRNSRSFLIHPRRSERRICMKMSGINRLPWAYSRPNLTVRNYKNQIILERVRTAPALPLVEDVSLLILTPLVVCVRT
jgi:hypothetical protein